MNGRSARESPGAAGGRRELRAALFVDFDNMCISFEELDPLAAHRFATQPARWLAWFEKGLHALSGDDAGEGEEPVRRRILVRKCYLNPVTFGRYRADYTRAAFTVVDCPPLTQRGKTSADVYMVMDVLDALEHKTQFDEFIILSSDADFTPVLLRLRAYDRQTTILATNFAAATYKAACDLIVPYERFFEEALGIEPESAGLPHLEQAPTIVGGGNGGGSGSGSGSVGDHEALLPRVARALKERVAAAGPLGPREVPATFATFPEFRNSDWFGRFSLKGLMTRLLELEPGLVMLGDPNAAWSVRLRDGAPSPASQERREPDVARPGEQRAGGAGEVGRATMADTPRPVPIPAEQVDAVAAPDPTRHDRGLLETAAADRLRDFPEEPEVFFGRVADATGVPALGPAEYARLFEAVAVVAAIPDLDFNERARQIRDALQAEGLTVSRAQVNFVLNVFRQNRIEIARLDAGSLATAWRDITLTALRNALVPLSPEELRLIDRWLLLGGGGPAVTPADEPPPEDEAPVPLAPPVEAGTEAA